MLAKVRMPIGRIGIFDLSFAGDIVCYNNLRVLHGRTGYQVLEQGAREVEGGNLDWDELRSKRRVLATKLGITE